MYVCMYVKCDTIFTFVQTSTRFILREIRSTFPVHVASSLFWHWKARPGNWGSSGIIIIINFHVNTYLSVWDDILQQFECFHSFVGQIKWMPFKEYAAQPFTQKHEPFKYLNELCLAKLEKHYIGFSPRPLSSYFKEHLDYLYLNTQHLYKPC